MKGQISESFLVGALLAVTGGFLDAYTYFLRGGVFANAQTGNVVLVGLNLAQGNWALAGRHLIPVLTFSLGVLVAEWFRHRGHFRLHWRQVTVALEIAVLLLASFLPAPSMDFLVNLLVAFVCAVQVESFRKVNGNAYATTMCTGNLRSGTERLFTYFATGEGNHLVQSLQYFGVIALFAVGVALGTLLAAPLGLRAVLVPCGLLALVFFLMFLPEKGEVNSDASAT